ncbi:MAG TPA: hemerythrin domain-containing protein [Thermoanaerobaculia bacterium]|nr:hemerythrin domain-containing protein [Thermoanaerobaculia bacterium]
MGRSPDTPDAVEHAGKRRIDEEHLRLRELLGALAGETDLTRVGDLLGELRELLVAHFATEEGPQGLHQIVEEGAAHRLPNVQHLFEEHRQILVRVDDLIDDVGECLAGPVRRVVDEVAAIAETLRRHEHDEEALFTEAFYSDIGGRS